MRHPAPLILGAGPAGSAAAIELARAGAAPILIDRGARASDPLCGGFLSWRTAAQLQELCVDCGDLGAHPVRELRLFAGAHGASVALPAAAFGLSRHTLDNALRARALEEGASLEVDTIRRIEGNVAHGEKREWAHETLFLASGKHDVRGKARPRNAKDPALGLRLRLSAGPELASLLEGAIEMHLFPGGYAGVVRQEAGSANICLALRKSVLAKAGGDPHDLLFMLANQHPQFARRLDHLSRETPIQTIGAVPYGWRARTSRAGLFRLGDQAAVIPSLAGEGISIALASGTMAARRWLECGPMAASGYQSAFAGRAAKPLRIAALARHLAETPGAQPFALWMARFVPALAGQLIERTRIG